MGIYVEMAAFKNSMSKRLISRAIGYICGYICLDNYCNECYSDGLYAENITYPGVSQNEASDAGGGNAEADIDEDDPDYNFDDIDEDEPENE